MMLSRFDKSKARVGKSDYISRSIEIFEWIIFAQKKQWRQPITRIKAPSGGGWAKIKVTYCAGRNGPIRLINRETYRLRIGRNAALLSHKNTAQVGQPDKRIPINSASWAYHAESQNRARRQ